jgi:hypothetical protein
MQRRSKQQSLHQRLRRCTETRHSSTHMDGTSCWESGGRAAGRTVREHYSTGKIIWHVVPFENTLLNVGYFITSIRKVQSSWRLFSRKTWKSILTSWAKNMINVKTTDWKFGLFRTKLPISFLCLYEDANWSTHYCGCLMYRIKSTTTEKCRKRRERSWKLLCKVA